MRLRRGAGTITGTPLLDAPLVDAALAGAWVALVADGVWQTHREHAARAVLGPIVVERWQPSVAAGLAVLASTLAGALALERLTGRLAFYPAVAVIGSSTRK